MVAHQVVDNRSQQDFKVGGILNSSTHPPIQNRIDLSEDRDVVKLTDTGSANKQISLRAIPDLILAEAAYFQGYRGVTSAPTFGPERRGAPLTASTRISSETVRVFSQIEHADVSVVLDESLLQVVDVLGSLKKGGLLIINTACDPAAIAVGGDFRIATVDAADIALKHHLLKEGKPMVNTPLLGAFCRATGIVGMHAMEKGLKDKLGGGNVTANLMALRAAFERTRIQDGGTD